MNSDPNFDGQPLSDTECTARETSTQANRDEAQHWRKRAESAEGVIRKAVTFHEQHDGGNPELIAYGYYDDERYVPPAELPNIPQLIQAKEAAERTSRELKYKLHDALAACEPNAYYKAATAVYEVLGLNHSHTPTDLVTNVRMLKEAKEAAERKTEELSNAGINNLEHAVAVEVAIFDKDARITDLLDVVSTLRASLKKAKDGLISAEALLDGELGNEWADSHGADYAALQITKGAIEVALVAVVDTPDGMPRDETITALRKHIATRDARIADLEHERTGWQAQADHFYAEVAAKDAEITQLKAELAAHASQAHYVSMVQARDEWQKACGEQEAEITKLKCELEWTISINFALEARNKMSAEQYAKWLEIGPQYMADGISRDSLILRAEIEALRKDCESYEKNLNFRLDTLAKILNQRDEETEFDAANRVVSEIEALRDVIREYIEQCRECGGEGTILDGPESKRCQSCKSLRNAFAAIHPVTPTRAELLERVGKLEKALGWYAVKRRYWQINDALAEVIVDKGSIAREVLSTTPTATQDAWVGVPVSVLTELQHEAEDRWPEDSDGRADEPT